MERSISCVATVALLSFRAAVIRSWHIMMDLPFYDVLSGAWCASCELDPVDPKGRSSGWSRRCAGPITMMISSPGGADDGADTGAAWAVPRWCLPAVLGAPLTEQALCHAPFESRDACNCMTNAEIGVTRGRECGDRTTRTRDIDRAKSAPGVCHIRDAPNARCGARVGFCGRVGSPPIEGTLPGGRPGWPGPVGRAGFQAAARRGRGQAGLRGGAPGAGPRESAYQP